MIVEFYEDVVQISGSLRSNFWDTIHTAISLALQKHPKGVIVDCSGITECTVEGADTFRDAMEYISRQDALIILAAVPAEVQEIVKSIPEVRSQLAIASSVQEAKHTLALWHNAEGKGANTKAKRVGLHLCGAPFDTFAMSAAARMARSTQGHVHIIFPIVVPRDLPLHAPLPQQEELAVAAVDKVKELLDEKNLPYTVHIERGRDVGVVLNNVCENNHVEYLFVPLPNDPEAAASIVRSILSRLKCTVSFIRGEVS